jgi:two-component system NarL family sensor kinase
VLAWSLAVPVVALSVSAVAVGADAGSTPWKLVLVPAFWVVPGVLVASGRPANPLGWLMLAVAGLFAGAAFGTEWLDSGQEGGAAWATWFVDRASAFLVPCTLAVLLLLPDGRLPSPRWRPVAWLALGAQVTLILAWCLVQGPAAAPDTSLERRAEPENPVGLLPAAMADAVSALEPWLLQVPLLLGVVAVGFRIRRGSDDQRPRLVSVLAASAVFALLLVAGRYFWPGAADVLDVAGAGLLAAALTSAVLRRRLHEVDVVVNHALVYSVLTALITLGYLAVVAGTSRLGGDLPSVGVALVAAALAVVLLPLRSALQRLLQRAMYGDSRDPHAAVRRLTETVGEATSLDAVVAGLVRATAGSLRASQVEVQVDGAHASHGDMTAASEGERVSLALTSGELRLGTLTVGFPRGRRFGPRERELLVELADHGARAVHAVLLADALLANRQLLVTTREEERSRLRRDLHDELGPTLAGLAMQLGGLRELLRTDPAIAAKRLARLEAAARHALDDVRRVSRELRPPSLDELGLVGALERVAEEAGLDLTVVSDPLPPMSAATEVAAYRIGAEALLNVARHAGPTRAELELLPTEGTILLRVVDHGRGVADAPAGVGTLAMRERAVELGGTLLLSGTDGGGTTVEARLPLPDPTRPNLLDAEPANSHQPAPTLRKPR